MNVGVPAVKQVHIQRQLINLVEIQSGMFMDHSFPDRSNLVILIVIFLARNGGDSQFGSVLAPLANFMYSVNTFIRSSKSRIDSM